MQQIQGEVNAIPIVVLLQSLTVADNIAVVPLTQAVSIKTIFLTDRGITAGTTTVVVKNDGGTTLASVSATTTSPTQGTVSVADVAAANALHINITALGTNAADLSVVIWARPKG